MTTNTLPVDNVIDVTVTSTPQGLTAPNVNSVALFTQDAPINGEAYGIYISPSQVASNYGTNTKTAAMANNIFAQLPNIMSGRGRLVIIPMLAAVSALPGNWQSANISANLAGIIAVENGSVNIVIDSVSQALTGLNFANCETFADVAAVIQAATIDAQVTAIANGVEITSNKVGTSSTVAITSNMAGTDLNGVSYLHGATGTATEGSVSTGETIAACIARTSNLVQYVPIMTTLDLDDTAISAAASAVQALDNMFIHHCASSQDIAGIATTVQQATQTKTRILVYTQNMAAANLMKAAYVGRAFSVDFTGSKTSQTMNLKTLANVTPDTGITQTLWVNAGASETTGAGCDVYVSFGGSPSVTSNGANMYFDEVYSDLALKFDLQTNAFNYLKQTNTKIPQTEPGMKGYKDSLRQVMNQYVTNGSLAPGQWDSPETFGDPTIFTNNITAKGFYIFTQPVAQQDSEDRDNRIAPVAQIAGKRAGALHSGNVLVNMNA